MVLFSSMIPMRTTIKLLSANFNEVQVKASRHATSQQRVSAMDDSTEGGLTQSLTTIYCDSLQNHKFQTSVTSVSDGIYI